MRVITACDVIPGAGRQGLRLLARPAPAALGVPPRTARTRPALRARRHPEGADPQRVARRVSAVPCQEHAVIRDLLGAAQDFTPSGLDMFKVAAGIRVLADNDFGRGAYGPCSRFFLSAA